MKKDQLSIYIHIPFCITKCPYCAFNSYEIGVEKNYNSLKPKLAVEESEYTKALISEIQTRSNEFNKHIVKSIFFGGGTPSLFSGKSINLILKTIKDQFNFQNCETTLESNPHSISEPVSVNRLALYKDAGVNRISMGVQSFRDDKLKFLGRLHSAKEVYSSMENLRKVGFKNINLDFIFGTKLDTTDSWGQELKEATKLKPDHLSCYSLSIEPGTVFEKLSKTKNTQALQASDELCAELYKLTQNTLINSGYDQYEVSNYSKPHKECIHNLSYWDSTPYLGIGAGAHSYDGDSLRKINYAGPKQYVKNTLTNQSSIAKIDTLCLEDKEIEFFYTRMRVKKGFSLKEYENIFSIDIYDKHSQTIKTLEKLGMICTANSNIFPTEKGLLFNDSVVEMLVKNIS